MSSMLIDINNTYNNFIQICSEKAQNDRRYLYNNKTLDIKNFLWNFVQNSIIDTLFRALSANFYDITSHSQT
jgi:hypothetical protein